MKKQFGCTIKRDITIKKLIAKGTPYKSITPELVKVATSHKYELPIIMDKWILPAGAYGDQCGAT